MRNRSIKSLAHALLGATLLVLSACDLFTGPEEARFTFALSSDFVAPASEVTVEVTNRASRTWHYIGGCGFYIQREVEGEWQDVYDNICFAALREPVSGEPTQLSIAPIPIEPGQTVALVFHIPSDAIEGLHRFRLRFIDRLTGDTRDATRFSPPFTVALPSLGPGAWLTGGASGG